MAPMYEVRPGGDHRKAEDFVPGFILCRKMKDPGKGRSPFVVRPWDMSPGRLRDKGFEPLAWERRDDARRWRELGPDMIPETMMRRLAEQPTTDYGQPMTDELRKELLDAADTCKRNLAEAERDRTRKPLSPAEVEAHRAALIAGAQAQAQQPILERLTDLMERVTGNQAQPEPEPEDEPKTRKKG